MLTGERPFQGKTAPEILDRVINKSPTPPTELKKEIPPEVERIISRCLEKQPTRRYHSAEGLLSDLFKLRSHLERRALEEVVEKERTPEVQAETEWKQATILFAEISGYDEILEHLDTEEAATLMSRCFAKFGSVIKKYNGRIEKISGSTLLALFGVPQAVEDAPKKAINAAIELRNELSQFNEEEKLNIKLDLHIGINTGWVVTGAIDTGMKKESSVMGEAVNLASALKGLTAKGQVFVGGLAYRFTKNEFEYRKLRPIILKEKKDPVPVYELLSSKTKVYRAVPRASRMIHSEMVGRDRDLDRLKLQLLKAINGEGSIVNVIGEAGIGKSRLVSEFCESEDLRKVQLLKGRALSIGRNLSFHPIIDLLKSWTGITEEDGPEDAIRKLEKKVRNVHPDGADEILPFVAILMGMKLTGKREERVKGVTGEALEKIILKNFRELIHKAAEHTPLVFIIEDLHWSDATSLELLESVYRLAHGDPILFINVFRPNYEQTSDRILETIRSRYGKIATEISLEPLSESHADVLIANLLHTKDLPKQTKDLITKRTEGNPFFIEEVARTFIDEGVVELKEGQVHITDKIQSVVIPETINEVLMARIDKLDEDTRSLLKIASVIGRNFFYKILADVAKTIEEIDDRLLYLKEAQLIKEQMRMEEVEYLFKHALAQEAVYNSLLQKNRKRLHLEVAQSIEHVFGKKIHEFYGMLAYHFTLGEDPDKADEYLIKAGEEALKSSASNEALHYYQEALRIYLEKHGKAADRAKVAMLEKNIAIAFFNKGEFTEAVEHFDKVLGHLGEKMPKKPLAMILKFLPGFASFVFRLYIPSLTKIKAPTPKTREIIGIYEKKSRALATLDPKRMFIDSFFYLPRLVRSDLSQLDNGVGLFVISSGLF